MERKINSLAGLSSTKKRNQQFMKLAETFNTNRLINEAIINSEAKSFDAEINANVANAKTLKEKNKCKAKKNKKLCEELKISIISECFASLVYDSIMLDEDFKLPNKERLINKFKETFLGLTEKGFINGTPSPLYEAYIEPAVSVFPSIDSNIEEPQKIIASIKTVESDLDASREKLAITETIRDKVLDVIKEEKVFASKRNFLKETYRKNFDGTSLFNSINMYNFKELKNDMLASKDDLTLDHFNSSEKLIEQVNNEALAETICDYTLLETLNTCGLIKEDCNIANNAKKLINFLHMSEQ